MLVPTRTIRGSPLADGNGRMDFRSLFHISFFFFTINTLDFHETKTKQHNPQQQRQAALSALVPIRFSFECVTCTQACFTPRSPPHTHIRGLTAVDSLVYAPADSPPANANIFADIIL